MTNYLLSLQAGLSEIARTVTENSPICVVVQDSHYKEVHVDLQLIVSEIFESRDRPLSKRYDYPATALLSKMNPRARVHLPTRTNTETLLVFR